MFSIESLRCNLLKNEKVSVQKPSVFKKSLILEFAAWEGILVL